MLFVILICTYSATAKFGYLFISLLVFGIYSKSLFILALLLHISFFLSIRKSSLIIICSNPLTINDIANTLFIVLFTYRLFVLWFGVCWILKLWYGQYFYLSCSWHLNSQSWLEKFFPLLHVEYCYLNVLQYFNYFMCNV